MSAPVAPASRRPPHAPVERRHHTDLLTAHDLAVSIGGKTVVTGLNLDLPPGERLVLLGRNGIGKTTLLHTLAGLRAPDSGDILLAGQTYKALGPRGAARLRGLLPQHQGDAFSASVLETVLIGRHPHLSRWDWESETDEQLAREALAAVGLADLAAAGPSQGSQGAPSGGSERSERGGRSLDTRSIHTLSGGERQRVALATLLAQQPTLYLLDEPLAHLDLNHQIGVLELMSRRVREEQAALVMVLHDINLAARYSDQALLLHGAGEYKLGKSEAVLDAAGLSRLYGHPLRVIEDGERHWFVPEVNA